MNAFCRTLTWFCVAVSCGFTLILTGLWWLALPNQWVTCVSFNDYGEAIAEGVLFHSLLLLTSAFTVIWWGKTIRR